jgi:hypothetical protein
MHPRHTIWFFRVCSFQRMMIHGDTKNYPNPLFGRAQDQQSWCKALKTRNGFRLAAFSISTSSVWPLHSRNRFFSRRKPALEGVLQLTHDQVASFAQHYQWIDVHETIGWSICPRQSIDLHKASIFYKLLLLGCGLILDVGSVSLGSGRSPLLHQSGEVFPRQLRGDGVVAKLVWRILEIVRDFLFCIENASIIRSRRFLRRLVSPQPYLSLVRCGSNLRHPLVKLRPVPHASELRRGPVYTSSIIAASSTATARRSALVCVPCRRRLLIQIYVPQLVVYLQYRRTT